MMFSKNNTLLSLLILGSITFYPSLATSATEEKQTNLRGRRTTIMNENADDRKLYQYNYYWTKTGSNRYFRGDFKENAPDGWVRQDWVEGPPIDTEWIEDSWSEDESPDYWERYDGPDDRKLYQYNYYWTKTGSNRYFRGDFEGDGPDGWVRQDWIEGPPTDTEWIEGSWSEDESPDYWDAFEGPDDRKLYQYNYYWTKTGSNEYFRGKFDGDTPDGWVRQAWGTEGPPTDTEWIEGSWSEGGPDRWESWDSSWSNSLDGP